MLKGHVRLIIINDQVPVLVHRRHIDTSFVNDYLIAPLASRPIVRPASSTAWQSCYRPPERSRNRSTDGTK